MTAAQNKCGAAEQDADEGTTWGHSGMADEGTTWGRSGKHDDRTV